jgi:transglutaminase-like putative cysteine protease
MTGQVVRQQLALSAWGWFATLAVSMALGTLVAERRYIVVAALLLGIVVAVGATLRLSRLPRSLVVGAQLLLALEVVVIGFTDSLLPTPDAYDTLVSRFAAFIESAQSYASPLPRDPDTTMALAVIVLAVGLLVDVVGVTLRRVPVLGLLFLLVYMVPVAHRGGDVSLFSFLPGAIGFVFMLAADEQERLTHWGRQIRTVNAVWRETPTDVDDTGLRRSRLRIGFGAVAIAAVLPILVPSIDPQILFDGGTGEGGSGSGGDVQVDDPSLDMRRNLAQQSDAVLLRVRGATEPAYFRLAALDEVTDDSWRVGDRLADHASGVEDRLPSAFGSGIVAQQRVEYDVEVTNGLDTTWLPVVYAPREISIETPWLVDRTHFDIRADSDDELSGTSYHFESSIPSPSINQLQAAGAPPEELQPFLELPSATPDIVTDVAEQATRDARTPIDEALALESWFRDRGGYTYSLDQVDDDRNRTGLGSVEAFLQDRVGYCEQYASAMALMARRLGIPSRVAVGFLRPERVGDGVWEFRGYDMHAWPELFFEGVGWVRFDPTPQSVSGAGTTFRGADDPGDLPTNTAGPSETTAPTRDPLAERSTPSGGAGTTGSDDTGGPSATLVAGLAGVVVLVLLLGTPRLLRELRARRRWSDATTPETAAEAAWAELRDGAIDLRVDWDDDTTPRHNGRRLREQLADAASHDVVVSLNHVVIAVEQSRYARSPGAAVELRPEVERVLDALASRRTPAQLRRARWWPASLWRSRQVAARDRARDPRREHVLTLGD